MKLELVRIIDLPDIAKQIPSKVVAHSATEVSQMG